MITSSFARRVVFVLVVLALVGCPPIPPLTTTVPNVVGVVQASAEASIMLAGLDVGSVARAYSDAVPTGSVISQDPQAGSSVAVGTSVDLVVSLGSANATVPDVVGMTQAAAEAAITAVGLTVGTVTEDYSDTTPAGCILDQDPAAWASVAVGTAVDLVVSLGSGNAAVPDVVGMTQAAAEAAITAVGLTVGIVSEEYSDTTPAGCVISQDPAALVSAAMGTSVDLVVSLGSANATVPDVVGMTQAAAEAAITAAGLTVGTATQEYSASLPVGNVISQYPVADASVAYATAVHLVVSRGPAPIFHVNKATPAAPAQQDGLSWDTAFATIQPAIEAACAVSGGEVWVAAAVYDETRESYPHGHDGDWTWDTASLIIRPGVPLYGGFTGVETDRAARDWAANQTVIDGSKALIGASPARHVIVTGEDATLDGFTITGGNARGGDERGYGGGIYLCNNSLTVTNCVFQDNSAEYDGGAISAYYSTVSATFINCVFQGNSAGKAGGGIYMAGYSALFCSATLTNCVFEGNSSSEEGGGVYAFGASMTVSDCTFDGNSVGASSYGGNGGGMCLLSSDSSITDCRFQGNSATRGVGGGVFASVENGGSLALTRCVFDGNSAVDGGGMYMVNGAGATGSSTVTNCVFVSNCSAVNGGGLHLQGGIHSWPSPATLVNCSFERNSASYFGGGLYNDNGSPTCTNCVFETNGAFMGGGIFAGYRGFPRLTNCTLYGNTDASGCGSGATRSEFGAELFLRNCIVWGTGSNISTAEDAWTYVQYSQVQGGYAGTGNLSGDPLFVDAANGDFRLQAGSPCIDTGTADDAPAKDIRGISRPQGTGVDRGAYEMTPGEM